MDDNAGIVNKQFSKSKADFLTDFVKVRRDVNTHNIGKF